MKSKALIPLVVGLAVGIVAIKYTMDAVKKAKGNTQQSELVTVVMAQKDIPATVQITPDMLVSVQTPRTATLAPDIFTEPTKLEGRVALKSIPRGSPVLGSMIAPEGTLPGLTVRVKEGYRAVAVKIDESSGVGYLVHPNDWVDVMAVMEVRKFGQVKTESKLVLERVQVAAVGQALNDKPEEGASRNVQTVTLLVKVEDVSKLHMAQTRGRITLAMRGSADMTITQDEKEDEDTLNALAQAVTTTVETPEPEPVDKTVTVQVINDSADGNDRNKSVNVTFSGEDSMDVVEVDQGGRKSRRSYSRRSAPRTPASVDEDADNRSVEDETDSNEVSE